MRLGCNCQLVDEYWRLGGLHQFFLHKLKVCRLSISRSNCKEVIEDLVGDSEDFDGYLHG